MLTRRQRWALAAGVLLGATTGGVGTAQDSGKRPAVLLAPTNSSALPEKTAAAAYPSPYFAIGPEPLTQGPNGRMVSTAVSAPKAEPAAVPASAPAAAPVVSQSSCNWPPDNPQGCASPKSSFRSRCRHRWQQCFWGFPEEFEAAPLGYSVYLNGRTQVANGEAARMVLYHYDFVEGRDELNPRGRYQLEKITALLPQNFNPLIIEATPDAPGMDEARRVAIVRELAKGPFPVPADRVVIGRPIAIPLSGVEAELIYRNLLLNTESEGLRGRPGGAARTGTTSSGVLAPSVSPGP